MNRTKRSWGLLKRGGILVTTLTEPSQETAQQYAKTFPLADAAEALASVEHGGTVGKVVLAVS